MRQHASPRPPRPRRLRLAAAGTSVVLAVVAGWAVRAASAPDASGPAAVPARSADAFVNSVCVNTHMSYLDTAYGNFDAWSGKLGALGVRCIRDGLDDRDFFVQRARTLKDSYGVRILQGVAPGANDGRPWEGPPVAAKIDRELAKLKKHFAGITLGIEGRNECDLTCGEGWQAGARSYSQQLHAKMKADPALRDLPVLSTSMAFSHNFASLGDVSGSIDVCNPHTYPGGNKPSEGLAANLANSAKACGTKPVWATETGYHTALNNTNQMSWGQRGVSEAAEAKYMPRLFAEYFRQGVAKTFAYEFLDERPNPGGTDQEQNFGLLRADYSEKPAYTALKNTLGLLADPGPAHTPAPLSYALEGDTTDVRQVLLGKRNGEHWLALWQEVPSFDTGTKKELSPAARPLTLRLGGPAAVSTYQPTRGTGATGTATGSSVPLSVRDELLLVKVAGGGGATPAPTASGPGGKPDLVVRDATWSPAAPATGAPVTFSATVANVGTGAWPADVTTGVAFLVDGKYATWSDDTRKAIPPGGTVTVTANGGPQQRATWTAAAGEHRVEAIVDDVNRYGESDEGNNARTEAVTAGPASPTGSPTASPTVPPAPSPTGSPTAPIQPPGPVSGPPGGTSGWRSTLADDFTSFDAAKWSRDWPCGNRQPVGCFFDSRFATHYPDRNSAVADGTLRITTKREASAGKDFTSGVVSTVGKLEQTGGYFEVRMKPTCVQGNDPAFWLASRQTWPPEIDIAECPGGREARVMGSPILHAQNRADQARIATAPDGTRWSDTFHTYGLLWEPGKRLVGYVDGKATGEITEGVPDEPMFVILSDEVRGGSDGGAWFGDAAKFPGSATSQFDWVRVWQRA